ncbi:response regulator transcription factor [Cohnella rhizosphaerae]|uniref:Response regulator n=1 Tax=Cohnella rhizosphaerae TaxID=1457232 RepID=A0A9X4KP48_9BACL|nr:response regulator [Cohnella rhizosphaerae]MDG0808173.1 response regulator [Cohnella rhizosphaerae]
MKLMLVDDEPMLLKSMAANDWEKIGIEEVRMASSGLEAAELLKQAAVDIVVTDIRMPGMDGLALCRHIQERYPRTKCILLSGYGEFEYAREAIRYGTERYLLKPIKDEELMNEVAGVKAAIEREWAEIVSFERARQTLFAYLPLLREKLLTDLLAGASMPESALAERMDEYRMRLETGKSCALLLVRLDEGFGGAGTDALLYEYAVHNIAGEILEAGYRVWSCKDDYGYLCLLLQAEPGAGGRSDGVLDDLAIETAARELEAKIAEYLKGRVSVLIGGSCLFPGEIAERYRQSVSAFRTVPRSERGVVFRAGEARSLSSSLHALYSPPGLQQLLEAGRWADARAKLAAVFEELNARELDTEEHMLEIVCALTNAFLYIAHLQGKTLAEVSGGEADLATDPLKLSRSGQVAAWAFRMLDRLEAGSVREFKDAKYQLIVKIHRFIEDRIAEDVSLQTIADHVGLHPVYLSSLYKQETGENMSDYIMRFRMEKAGNLLRTTEIKIYELASCLGFQNPPYFSKLF